jgi:hypothetical protein
MPLAPPQLIQGAPRIALPYGLFSAFTFRAGDRWEGGVQFETGTCDPVEGLGAPDCVPGTPAVPGTSEVQHLTMAGPPDGGTFDIIYHGRSDRLAFDVSTATLQIAIRNVVQNQAITVTGGPLVSGTPAVITFPPAMGNVDQMSTASQLTGAGASVAFNTITPGVNPKPEGAPSVEVFGLPKKLDPNSGGVGEASPFTVYGHFNCLATGYTPQSAQDLATAHLLAREEQRVEQAFETGDLGNHPNLSEATEIASGTHSVIDGLAYLEYVIGHSYGSVGVIHMTRGMALQAIGADVVIATGGRLTTVLGTPVVAGGGYEGLGPEGSPALTAGQSWAYATPAIFGYRTEPFTSSNSPGDLFNRANNMLTAIAERSYLLGFDPCGVAAVLLQLDA